jgi:hypothetical protein
MTRKLSFSVIGLALLVSSSAMGSGYYSVAVDAATKTVTESVWQETQAPAAWAPQPLEEVLSRGVTLVLPTDRLVPRQAWEMDIGILQADGNILHLLGTATVSDVISRGQMRLAVVTADLSGVQDSDCRAHLSAMVDAGTHDIWVEKFSFHCLGREMTVATARHPKG